MAMPPVPAPAAPPPDVGAPPPGAPPAANDVGNEAEGAEGADEVVLTVCKDPAGGFTLFKGDEPEEPGEGTAAEEGAEGNEPPEAGAGGQHFDTPQALLKGIMELLNSDSGAEEGFAQGYAGGKGTAPAPGM